MSHSFAFKQVNKRARHVRFFAHVRSLGVYDPALIGDKPKWYSRDLAGISFKIVDDSSTLSQALTSFNANTNASEQTPTGWHHRRRSSPIDLLRFHC